MQEKILHLYLCDRHCIQSTHFISSCIPRHSNDKTVLKVQIRFQILDECGSVPMQSGSQQWHGLSTTARKEHATYLQSKTGDCLTDLRQQCQDGHRIKCAREALTAKHMVHHSDRLTLNHTQLSAETAPYNPFSAGTNLEHALTLRAKISIGEGKKHLSFGESMKSSTSSAAVCNVSIGIFSIQASKLNIANAKV